LDISKIKCDLRNIKEKLDEYGINYLNSPSHIIPIMINDPKKCIDISNNLLHHYDHYIQPINYPTVDKGYERFRLTITHKHTYEMIGKFIDDVAREIWVS